MASASTIPPSHVGTHSFQHDAGQPDPMDFPELEPSDINNNKEGEDWELVPEDAAVPQVKFQLTTSQQTSQQTNQEIAHKENPKMLLHSQSSPNLRDYTIEESESDSESSFEHVEQPHASQDDASSNFSLVSGTPSVNSIWSSRISFKDALLKKDQAPIPEDSEAQQQPQKKHHGQRIKKIKPKFIVQQVAPLKHAKSMGDLTKCLEDDDDDGEDVLGDSDAHEYYSRKAQGSLGRRNGRKQRPDEKKRLQITMAKKNSQRARQAK